MWKTLGEAAFYFGFGSLLLGFRKAMTPSRESEDNTRQIFWWTIKVSRWEQRYNYYLANFIILATASVAFFFGLVTLYALITGQPSPIR